MTVRRWRFYRTPAGKAPAREFLDALSRPERSAIGRAMKRVALLGLREARHLEDDLYEVRVQVDGEAYRLLFATEGRRGQVLLALEAFHKKTQQTPKRALARARSRLTDWRARARRPNRI